MTWDEALADFGATLARVEEALVTGEWPDQGWEWTPPAELASGPSPAERHILAELLERAAHSRAMVTSAQLHIEEQLKEADQHRKAARSYALTTTLK
ncbi:MAG: hypothetical protein ACRDJ2_17020 [Actinomycetota bacterium]